MATLGEIKTRIITETSRDDLSDDLATQLATHINRAIEYYSDTRFWFNAYAVNANTEADVATVTIPATIRRIDRVTMPAFNAELVESTFPLIDDVRSTTAGQPLRYAYYNDSIWLYPVPDAVYTLRIYGLAQIDPPSADGNENVWTDEAQDLIVNHAKMTLFRDQFRDPEGVQLALGATQDAYKRLRRETARRLTTRLSFHDAVPGQTDAVLW